jgi:hypothetical protein
LNFIIWLKKPDWYGASAVRTTAGVEDAHRPIMANRISNNLGIMVKVVMVDNTVLLSERLE